MKVRNNEKLNKLFLIMGIFSIMMLAGGFQLGFEFKNSMDNALESSENSTIKAITANDNTLMESLVPKLTIIDSNNPVHCYYDIENVTNAEIYVERVKVNVYDQNKRQIYSTEISLYKTYNPGDKDRILFQVPKSVNQIGSINIEFE